MSSPWKPTGFQMTEIAMMAIANLQYAWTLFTKPMQAHLGVSLTAIQGIFSLFILLETWLVPFEGYLVDRIGPRLMLGLGGILVGLGWVFLFDYNGEP